MVSIKALRLDLERAEKGRWVPYLVAPVELLIGSIKSTAFQDGYNALLRDRLRHVISDEAREAIDRECRLEAASRWLLLGWRFIDGDATDSNGQPVPLPYSPEQSLAILKDPELVEMLDFVWMHAGETDKYRKAALADAVKT